MRYRTLDFPPPCVLFHFFPSSCAVRKASKLENWSCAVRKVIFSFKNRFALSAKSFLALKIVLLSAQSHF